MSKLALCTKCHRFGLFGHQENRTTCMKMIVPGYPLCCDSQQQEEKSTCASNFIKIRIIYGLKGNEYSS